MDVGTVVHRLKRGLYGSVRDLFMAPPAAVVQEFKILEEKVVVAHPKKVLIKSI
jgi:hypothetical protein